MMIEQLIQNDFIRTASFYSVAVLSLIVFLVLFELVTKYSNWQEIKRGNLAVGLATGGKIFASPIFSDIRSKIQIQY